MRGKKILEPKKNLMEERAHWVPRKTGGSRKVMAAQMRATSGWPKTAPLAEQLEPPIVVPVERDSEKASREGGKQFP